MVDNTCTTPTPTCPEGQTMVGNTCTTPTPTPTCPAGTTHVDADNDGIVDEGECTPDVVKTCPDGTPKPMDGNCGSKDDDDTSPPFTCPVDMTVKDNGDATMDSNDCVVPGEPVTTIGPITPSNVEEIVPAAVLGVTLEQVPEALRSTEVQGVQIQAPASAVAPATQAAPLARTGADNSTGILVLLGAFLLALGTALVRVGGRRPVVA